MSAEERTENRTSPRQHVYYTELGQEHQNHLRNFSQKHIYYREMEAREPRSGDGEVQESWRPATLFLAACHSDVGGFWGAAGRTSCLPPAQATVAFPNLTLAPSQNATCDSAGEGPVSRLVAAVTQSEGSRLCDRPPNVGALGGLSVRTHLLPYWPPSFSNSNESQPNILQPRSCQQCNDHPCLWAC